MGPESKVERGSGPTVQAKLAGIQPGGITYLTREEWKYMQDHAIQPRDPLLQEREKTHGTYYDNAKMWDDFCKVIGKKGCGHLRPPHQLSLMMIFLKIARLYQNPEIKDHWDDIAGYAKLGSEACEP